MLKRVATKIVSTLNQAGFTAYFAGGWVRDFLLGRPSDDIDIATNASSEEVQKLFPKTIPVGLAFGIVIVVEEGHQFEVASFRKERDYIDGRRPNFVEKASAEEDAQRRDFTINGMFFDPIENKLFDFIKGQEDIKKGIIRAIGDPHHRLLEDRLRMIRAVRYSTRFNFSIDIDTEQAILSHAGSLFPSVAIERVWQEFQKMSQFAHFAEGLEKLYNLRLLETIFPALKNISPAEMHKRLKVFSSFPKSTPLIVELAHLFPDDSLEKHLELCDYLKLSRKDKDYIVFFHRAKSLLTLPLDWQEKVSNFEWTHFYSHALSPLFLSLYSTFAAFHEEKLQILTPYILRIQQRNPLVTASDLQDEGIVSGPIMGTLLKEAEKLSINLQTENKEQVIKALKELPLWPNLLS